VLIGSKKKADGAAAYAGKMWWQLNETKKEIKCAKYGNCKAVPKVLKQANKAQHDYDHLAGIMKQKNSERDALMKENSEAKGQIELLTPQTKAAWNAHAKWEAALHPPTTTTKKSHHKQKGHSHKEHGHKHEKDAKDDRKRHGHDSDGKDHEHAHKKEDADDDLEMDDEDLDELSA